MIKVVKLSRTCIACPSQWEGETEDGKAIYVRSRHDCLSVRLGVDLEDAITKGTEIIDLDDDAGGWLTFEELKELTKNKIEWPLDYKETTPF